MKTRYTRKTRGARSLKKRSRRVRKGGGVKCPNCGSTSTSVISPMQALYQCGSCGKTFTNN